MKVVSIGAVLLGVAFACYEFFHWMTHVYEFDARIKSDLTRVSSKVDGTIEKILFKEGDEGYIEGETHGIIAAPNDSPGYDTGYDFGYVKWMPFDDLYLKNLDENYSSIGKGVINTNRIVKAYKKNKKWTRSKEKLYAAGLCDDYEFKGKKDWHLPTIDELKILMKSLICVFFPPEPGIQKKKKILI